MPATHKLKALIQMALKSTELQSCLTRNKSSTLVSSDDYEYIKSETHTIEYRLRQASIDKPANIPILIIRSHIPNAQCTIRNQIRISKGKAVNALFMVKDWIYVKTHDDKEGFLPKRCINIFDRTQKTYKKVTLNHDNHRISQNHTYTSIRDNEDDEYNDRFDNCQESTNLSLFSISRLNLDMTHATATTATDTTTLKVTSRNRKASLHKKIPSFMTLTMLEKHHNESLVKNQVRKNLIKKSLKTSIVSTSKRRVLLRTQSSESSTCSTSSMSNDEYDMLMTCSSDIKHKYQLFQCIQDYQADFKGDLCVKRGELVYLVGAPMDTHTQTFSSCTSEWLQVRKFNTKSNIIEEGFVPRGCVIRIYDTL